MGWGGAGWCEARLGGSGGQGWAVELAATGWVGLLVHVLVSQLDSSWPVSQLVCWSLSQSVSHFASYSSMVG